MSSPLARLLATCCALGALASIVPATASASTSTCSNAAERQFARLVNHARTARGLRPLRLDRQLNRVSIRHSNEMRRWRSMVHTPLSRLAARITHERSYGENIAWSSGARSMTARQEARRIFRMFMNSPGHRANILRRSYTHHGVAFVYAGDRVWVTNTFSGTANPSTRLRRNRC